MERSEHKLLIQQLLDRIENLENQIMVLKANTNAEDHPWEELSPLLDDKIESLTADFLKNAHKYDFNKQSGYATLTDGRIAYTKENEMFDHE